MFLVSTLTVPVREEYIIGPDTMLIIPVLEDQKVYSRIYEMNQEFICRKKPLDIIKESCIFYGSSFDGRKEATIALTNVKNKTPIIVSNFFTLFYFPTASVHKQDCIWISLEHVLYYKRAPRNTCTVTFRNKINYDLDVSVHIFNNQMLKTTHLKNLINRRMEEMKETKKSYWDLLNLKEILAYEEKNSYRIK